MSKSAQPYKLGNGGSVGGTVAKSFADVGTAISDAVTARSSVKKHQAGLQHLKEEAQADREHTSSENVLDREHELTRLERLDEIGGRAHSEGRDVKVDAVKGTYESKKHPALSAVQQGTPEPAEEAKPALPKEKAARINKIKSNMTGGSSKLKVTTPAKVRANAARRAK